MAEDILGISGHLDISDIQNSINALIDGLDKIGVKTDVLSKRMNDAMNEIARSTDDTSTKQKRAMDVLSQGLAEVKNALTNYPEQLRIAKNEADQTALATSKLETELRNLNGQLEKSVVGSKTYDELGRSITSVNQQISNNNALHERQLATIQEMEAGYNGLVSMLGLANTGTVASAVAHGTVTAATLAEAGAHTENASKISEETKAVNENITAKETIASADKETADAIKMETSSYKDLIERIKAGKVSTEEYSRTVEELRSRIEALKEEQEPIGKKRDIENEKLLTDDIIDGKLVSRGNIDLANELEKQYKLIDEQIKALENTLSDTERTWEGLHSKATQGAKETTQAVNETTQAEQKLNEESSKEPRGFKAQWNAVNELHDKIRELTKEHRSLEDEYDKLAEKPGFDPHSKKAKELIEKITNLRKEIADTKNEMSEEGGAGAFLAKFKNKLVDVMTGNGKFQESLGNIKTALNGLLAPFSAATAGATAFAKSLWAIIATPIGAIIGAIVLGLQAIHLWMTKDAEGQRAFAKVTAYLGSLLSSIMDIAVKVGKYLYHAFTDPQGSLNQFGKGLIGMVVNPLKAVAKTLSGVGQIVKGVYDLIASGANVMKAREAAQEIAKGWEDLKKASSSVVDTIGSVWDTVAGAAMGSAKVIGEGIKQLWGGDLGRLGDDFLEKAKMSADLAGREVEAQKALSEAKVEAQKIDIEIAKEREKIYTLTGKEKDAQIELVKNLLKQKYDGQIAQNQKLLDIQQERMKLHTNSLEAYAKERELQGAVYSIEAQRAASTRMLVRMQQSNLKAMENADKKDARKQQQISEADARYDEVVRKNINSREKAERDMEARLTDARIEAMKEGSEKVLAEKERAFKKELEQLDEQRRAAIEAERNRQKSEHDAREKVIKARGGKTIEWDDSMLDIKAINDLNSKFEELARLASEKRINEETRVQIESMRDYLKEYGTFQQQKLAIAQEYAEKIAKAQAEGDRGKVLRLKAERDKEIGSAKANELAQGIDFSQMFEGIGSIVKNLAEETYKRVQEYKKTDEYKKSSPESKKAISELEAKLIERGGAGSASPFSTKTWDNITKAAGRYDAALKKLQFKTQEHTVAVKRQEEAQKNYDKVMGDTNSSLYERLAAEEELRKANEEAEKTAEEQKEAKTEAEGAGNDVQNASKEAAQGLRDFDTVLGQITSGSLKGFADGVSNIIASLTKKTDDDMNGLIGMLSEKAGGIIGAILSIVDMLGDDPAGFIKNLLDDISKVIEAVLSQLPEIITSLFEGILNMVGSIFTGIGGLFGLSSSNREEIEKANNKLANATAVNTEAINRLTEEIKKSSPSQAYEAWEDAKRLMEINEKNAMRTMENNASMYDGGHSLWYDFKNYTEFSMEKVGNKLIPKLSHTGQEILKKMYSYLGKTPWDSSYDIGSATHDFTAEDWNRLLKEKPEWMTELGDIISKVEDEGNYRGIFQDIINFANEFGSDAYDSLRNTLNESITGVSLDSFKNNWISMLMDLAKKNKDFTKDFTEQLTKSFLNAQIEKKFGQKLEDLYNYWAEALQSGDELSSLELANLREQEEKLISEMQAERDRIFEITGYDDSENPDKQSTYNSLEKWSYDQADELIGRATAMQIIQQHIFEKLEGRNEYQLSMQSMFTTLSGNVGLLVDGVGQTIELHLQTNSKLDMIISNTQPIAEIRDIVKKIYKES